jgi:PAS domain S-box-containing protein
LLRLSWSARPDIDASVGQQQAIEPVNRAMNHSEFQLRGLSDPQLSVHATSAFPVWLWSTGGTRILWANPVGARLFGAANSRELANRSFGPADAHRRQVAQLAGRLPANGAIRMERLRGFGAPPGQLMTCACTRLDFSDGGHFFDDSVGILIVAHTAGRTMPLAERLQRLVEGVDTPVAAYARDGMFVGASAAAHPLLGFRNLSEAGLDAARDDALRQGRVETPIGIGHLVLQRVGRGADVGLVALIVPNAAPTTPVNAIAPAGFELVDEFAEPPAEMADEVASESDTVHETAPEIVASQIDTPANEPSPFVEAVADEPDLPSTRELASWLEEASRNPRQHPLRFVWQIDADGRFQISASEFTSLIGARTAALLNRPWSEIAKTFALDPDGRLAKAIASHDTWSGITVSFPADGGDHLPVELAGLPVFDRTRQFAGYRGFGVCRDLDGLTRLAALRRFELSGNLPAPQRLSADIAHINSAQDLDLQELPAANSPAKLDTASPTASEFPARVAVETSPPTDLERPVETPPNVVPFRPIGEPKSPTLTPVENSAFDELARQLSARLDPDEAALAEPPAATPEASEAVAEPQAAPPAPEPANDQPPTDRPANEHPATGQPANEKPDWLAPPEPPARGETQRDRTLLDLLPTGILIYRLDRLLYANPAFLNRIGYTSLHALEQAGGLDALYVEPGVSTASSTSQAGTPVTISASQGIEEGMEEGIEQGIEQAAEVETSSTTDARLFTITWDGDSALALICGPASFTPVLSPILPPVLAPVLAKVAEAEPAKAQPTVGHADAEDLAAILDTTAEGVVMFDAAGVIHACNRSAEALFGYDGPEFAQRNLTELFAPESQRMVLDYLAGIRGADVASLLDHGRDVLAREHKGGIIPLSMTMGRTRPGGPNFFAVFRDLSQSKKGESDPQQARQADRAANAKADMLARISHEVRTPLNAIIGFAEVMITERFGALGNERYVEYMKDIRSSGEHVIAIINDLLELSRIETGQFDLTFASQNLNDLVESCVTVMQPQANRERIIIRSSLAHALPPVVADAHALRQITLNLIGSSIHLANAGGQVIVSTALSDLGEVVLRVRDTGPGLNDNEVAAALEPFRNHGPSEQSSESSPVSLSLTKALVEANRAQFAIKTGARSGTLIEVVFSHALARS